MDGCADVAARTAVKLRWVTSLFVVKGAVMKKSIIILFCILAFIVIIVLEENRVYKSIALPNSTLTLSQFVQKYKKIDKVSICSSQDGNTHILIQGHMVFSFLAIHSGPPLFVFDKCGKLLDWTSDSGDDPVFSNAWDFKLSTKVSIKEALRLTTDEYRKNMREESVNTNSFSSDPPTPKP